MDLWMLLVGAGIILLAPPIVLYVRYLSYSKLTNEDAKAIIAYIKSIKPIENEVPSSEPSFPFSLIMKTIPTKAEPTDKSDLNDSLAYGKYITTIAGCADCHTPMEKGQPIEHLAYAGGNEFLLPDGNKVISANITPDDEFGIGAFGKNDFVKMFKFYENNDSLQVEKGEFNTIMPWKMYSGMTEKDLGAIYTYLRSVTPIKNKVKYKM